MKWTKVTERLPPHGRCLIFVPEHTPQVYIDGYGEVSQGYIGFAHNLMFITKVHSWAEVPEPPELYPKSEVEAWTNGNSGGVPLKITREGSYLSK